MPVRLALQPRRCSTSRTRKRYIRKWLQYLADRHVSVESVNGIATKRPLYYLTRKEFSVNCVFAMAASVQFVPAETLTEFEFPQREAAFFYGLFLRGHSADKLRQDIEVPPAVLAKWHREAEREPELRDILSRVVTYRRHVLAIFDTLVDSERTLQRPQ
jgi:hypothetical protein